MEEPHGPGRTFLAHLGDQRRSRTDSHGIINFSIGLVRALPAQLRPRERLVVLVNDELAPELGTAFLRADDRLEVIPAPRDAARRLVLDHRTVRRRASAVGADVILYPKGFLPLPPRGRRAAAEVVCLHDDIPVRQLLDRHTSPRRRLRAGYFSLLLLRSVRGADRRLFVSDFSAGRLARLGPAEAGDLTIHEGLTLPDVAPVPRAAKRRQAVLLGSHHRHKRVAAGLTLVLRDPGCREVLDRVVVVGPWDPTSLPRQDRTLTVDHVPGPVEGQVLAELIARSRLLLFPSVYEGFGLPPIEAFALGTPAVYRLTPTAREVMDGAPGGYPVETPEAFAQATAAVLAMDDADIGTWREHFRTRYRWDDVAARVAGALRTASRPADPPSLRSGPPHPPPPSSTPPRSTRRRHSTEEHG